MFIRKFRSYLFFATFLNSVPVFSGSLIYETFNSYVGTQASAPAGWTISNHDFYSSTGFSGASGPNAYKFSIQNASLTSPQFLNADSIRFWLKGAVVDTASYLILSESFDGNLWNQVSLIKPLSNAAQVVQFPLQDSSKFIRLTYFKSAGNLSLDDLEIFSVPNNPSGNIKIYFTRPVNINVSTGTNAVYLNQSLDDTLVAYINRSMVSLDVCVYNYVQGSNMAHIANAVNNAFNRGVRIRWIYDGSSSNTGLSLLNPSIPRLGSPVSASAGLMHNKFLIIDEESPVAGDAVVWSGSVNFTEQQFNSDFNNAVIIRDKEMAKGFRKEFDQMWGGSGVNPVPANSRFGSAKFRNNIHYFVVGGKPVEIYFSPSQNSHAQILRFINDCGRDIHFGIYAFTYTPIASALKTKAQGGLYVAGIMDQFSVPYAPDDTLAPVMGSALQIFSQGSLYHNKYMLFDHGDTNSNPAVLTGSHNWTVSADTKNDENLLFIKDASITNQFYQALSADFFGLGFGLDVNLIPEISGKVVCSPNPATGYLNYSSTAGPVQDFYLMSVTGELVLRGRPGTEKGSISLQGLKPGHYLLRFMVEGAWTSVYRLVISPE
jgi:hypothetical protein